MTTSTEIPPSEPQRKPRLKTDNETYRESLRPKNPAPGRISKLIKEHKLATSLVVVGVLAVGTGIIVGPPIYKNRQEKKAVQEKRAQEQAKDKKEYDQTPNPSIKVKVDYQFKDGKIDIKDATPKATIDRCEKGHQLIAIKPGETQIEGGGEFTVPVTLVFDGHEENQIIQYTAIIWQNRDNTIKPDETIFSLNNQ